MSGSSSKVHVPHVKTCLRPSSSILVINGGEGPRDEATYCFFSSVIFSFSLIKLQIQIVSLVLVLITKSKKELVSVVLVNYQF